MSFHKNIIGHLVEMFEGLNKFISCRYDRLVTGERQRAADSFALVECRSKQKPASLSRTNRRALLPLPVKPKHYNSLQIVVPNEGNPLSSNV